MMAGPAPLADIHELASYLREVSGIELDDSKGYLIETRLHGLLAELQCQGIHGLVDKARSDRTGKIREAVVDAVSTNETSFFREAQQFALLAQKLIPDHLEKAGRARLRIWCAAAASGQEVYSVAIVLKELLGDLRKHSIQILGTDISSAVLARASRARYTQLEVSRGLSPERIKRHFSPQGNEWAIADELRGLATFQRLNLLEPSSQLGVFDLVLCRNVSIYFSPSNRQKLFANIAAHLRPGGALLVSVTENLGGKPEHFQRREHRGVIYYERV